MLESNIFIRYFLGFWLQVDVYKRQGAGSGDELLKAVSFVTGDANTRYEISVTQNGQTQKVAEGVKKYAGFYTEALNQAIRIPQGGSFAVNVRLEAQEPGGSASIGIASNVQNATSGIEPAEGVSFISQNGQTVDSVSYTHLDVYKRQGQGSGLWRTGRTAGRIPA